MRVKAGNFFVFRDQIAHGFIFYGASVFDFAIGCPLYQPCRNLGSGYLQQWNLGVQREITRNLVFEIAYAGSKITHVGISDTNINQLTAEQLGLGSALTKPVPNPCFGRVPPSPSIGGATVAQAQTLRPFPCYTTVSLYRNNVRNTNYHALQTKIEQRFSNRLSFLPTRARNCSTKRVRFSTRRFKPDRLLTFRSPTVRVFSESQKSEVND